jgi:hypothetical protein
VDGVPESIIFGIQLVSGEPVSTAFIGAVFRVDSRAPAQLLEAGQTP